VTLGSHFEGIVPDIRGGLAAFVFWWHSNTPVFPSTGGSYVTHGPLTEADDSDAVVPGITQPLVQTEI
jgi:hypothetical protein